MVGLDVGGSVFGDCFRLGEPDGADFGVREDDCGNVFVGKVGVRELRRAKEAVGEVPSGCNGDWTSLAQPAFIQACQGHIPGVNSICPVTSPSA